MTNGLAMTEIEIHFDRKPEPRVVKTCFRHAGREVRTDQGSGKKHVQWSRRGALGFLWVLVRFALAGKAPAGSEWSDRHLPAGDNSPASSLRSSMEKEINWRDRFVLGDIVPIRHLMSASQRDGKPTVLLNEGTLPAEHIRIWQGKKQLQDATSLKKLADEIALKWREKGPADRLSKKQCDSDKPLSDEEKRSVIHLAAVSLEMADEQLPADVALLIGLARRVQLVMGFESQVRRAITHLDTFYYEVLRDPIEPRQLGTLVDQFHHTFSEGTEVIRIQGRFIGALAEITGRVQGVIEPCYLDIHRELQKIAGLDSEDEQRDALMPLRERAEKAKLQLADMNGQLIRLRESAKHELESTAASLESR